MKYKKIMFMLVLAVFLLSITCVSASEIDDTLASEDTNTIGLSVDKDIIEDNLQTSEENDELASTDYDEAIAQTDTEVLGADSATYFDLAEEIGQPGNINLIHKNYTYDGGEPITILEDNKVIDGNGAVIDMNGSTIRAFYISGSGVTIKNLTIKNVNSDGGGGAIYFYSTGTVTNCNFTDNIASIGGAISMYSGTVTKCNFTGNTATVNGGAVFFYSTGNVTNCNFTNNKATGTDSRGGAITMSFGTVTNCNFTNNTATSNGGAIISGTGTVANCNFVNNSATGEGSWGGAIRMYSGTVTNCNFTGNTAGEGGAVYFFNTGSVSNCNFTDNSAYRGGAVYFNETGTVSNCNFTDNSAYRGGAVYFQSTGNVTNCNFTNNTATGDGGAVYFNETGNVTNCNFTGNTATYKGGAVYFTSTGNVTNCNFTNNTANDDGGAVYFNDNGDVTNCNFINNTASSHGGAIWISSGRVENCNFTDNRATGDGGAIRFSSSSSTVSNCNFTHNSANHGSAVYFDNSGRIENCNLFNNSATRTGGAIYFRGSNAFVTNCNLVDNRAIGSDGGGAIWMNSGKIVNCNFTNNNAFGDDGGAVVLFAGDVENCNFINNQAINGNGGAIWMSTGSVTNSNFVNHNASYNGGAIWMGSGKIDNCNFTGNNATAGSAIFIYSTSDSKNVSNSCFLNNRANAENLDVTINENNIITITFTGNDNLLNAIYSNGDVDFSNVTYWGANRIANTDDSPVVRSKNEAGQNITVVGVVNGNIMNITKVTDSDGKFVLEDIVGDYCIIVRHNTDSYYTEAEKISTNMKLYANVTPQTTNNRTVNITAKSNIPNEVINGKLLFILLDGTADGMVIEANYSGNGTWWAKYTFADYGEYKVNATYVGLDNVTINNGTITINKVNSTITLDDVTLDYGESKNVTVTTTGATGIKANINGTNVTVINNYTILISDLAAGNYTLTVTTIPDKDHNPVTATSKITINKVESTLTVDNIEFDYNSEGSCDVSFTGASQVIANVVNQSSAVVSVNGKKITVSGLAAGTYTLNVTTVPDENHTAVTETAGITVNKINSTLTLEDVELDYGESKNITVAAEGATGITGKIDGVDVTVNNYTIPISGLGAGNYTLTVTTIADKNHNPITKEANITVNKLSTEIILANETLDLKVGDEVPVLVNLTPAGAGNLTFTSSDEDIVFVEDNVTIVANSQGQAIITVSFAGNENYTAAENKTITVNVALNDASVSVENDTLNLKVDETYAINATIKPDTILLKIKYTSSNESVATVDKNGIVTAVGEGTAIITLEVGDNEIYAKNSTTVTVNVKDNTVNVSASDLTKYYNGPESFVVIVTDSRNNPLANQSVIINVAGVNYTRTTDVNGTASIAISLISGQYNVTTIVGNNTVYSKITVLSTVNATDLVKVFRNATQFYATFKDSQGNYLADGTMVRFNINGVMYDRKISGNNGLAKLNINLEQGQYIITSMNLETGENAANNVTVISRLIENKELVKYYRNATQYTVKVIGDDGNPVGAGESVTFNINGVMYTRQTNGSGIAKLNINLHPGDYIITAEYKDCRVSNNIKVLPVLTADDLTKKYGTPDQFIATLVDGQGKPYAEQRVQFNINGVLYNRVTDSSGQAKLNIRLMPGKYVITSSYNGTNIANTITISA